MKNLDLMAYRDNPRRLFLLGMITALGASALVAIIVLLVGTWGETEFRIVASTMTIAGFSLTGFCGAVLFGRGRAIPLAVTGMAVAVVALVLSLLTIWDVGDMASRYWQLQATFMTLSPALAHVSLLLLMKRGAPHVEASRIATIVCVGIVTLMFCVLLWTEFEIAESFYYRLLGVFAILGTLGTIVTPLMHRMSAFVPVEEKPERLPYPPFQLRR